MFTRNLATSLQHGRDEKTAQWHERRTLQRAEAFEQEWCVRQSKEPKLKTPFMAELTQAGRLVAGNAKLLGVGRAHCRCTTHDVGSPARWLYKLACVHSVDHGVASRFSAPSTVVRCASPRIGPANPSRQGSTETRYPRAFGSLLRKTGANKTRIRR